MPNFRQILSQTSSLSLRRRGYYRHPIYRVQKRELVAADHITGTRAIYAEELTEISGDMFPFAAKRWRWGVTENFADFILVTNTPLLYDEDDDTRNDEIEYKDVRYRLVRQQHHERLAYSDMFQYAIRRGKRHEGDVAPMPDFLLQENDDYVLQENDDRIILE